MTEPLRVKWDGTVNWPMLVGLIIAVSSGAVYVNGKFDQLARVVEASAANGRRIDALEDEILKNREETLENRRIYRELEGDE